MFPQTWSTKAQIDIAAWVESADDDYEDFSSICLEALPVWNVIMIVMKIVQPSNVPGWKVLMMKIFHPFT